MMKPNDVYQAVAALGFKPLLIVESGSKAWGTAVETSDNDLTVIAEDVLYDIFSYPRQTLSTKVNVDGAEVDVRIFSLATFLRKVQKGNVVAYETVNSPILWYVHSQALLTVLCDAVNHCLDPRELFRNARGNLSNIRAVNQKHRRQTLRYMSTALQLIGQQEGQWNYLYLDVRNVLDAPHENTGMVDSIRALYRWAMHDVPPSVKDMDFISYLIDLVNTYDFPNVKNYKSGEHRDYMNGVFARLVEISSN